LYSTIDLGSDWTLETTAADKLRHMSFAMTATDSYGSAVGNGGTILYYVPRSMRMETKTPQSIPEGYVLHQNYPNPFNPSTRIFYQIEDAGHVRLAVYDVLGRQVATLVDAWEPAGHHELEFDTRGLASGLYLYKLVAGELTQTRKMMVSK